jgi:4-hydroxy-tetrahydrodipicolinate reductase
MRFMKIALFGYGKMGKAVEQLALTQGDEIVLHVSKNSPLNETSLSQCDVCIDFSSNDAVLSHIKWACRFRKPLVIGTTGWESDQMKAQNMIEESQNRAIYSPNFSLGVNIFIHLLQYTQKLYQNYTLSGVETHHSQKKDAPSGTAKAIKKALNMKEEFASVRTGSQLGKHEVLFNSSNECVHLIHEAKNRNSFAEGSLFAAKWLMNQNPKGWFTIDDLLRSVYSFNYPV